MNPQILIVVRASPIRERTLRLLQSIVDQGAEKLLRTAVLSQRRRGDATEFGIEGIEELPAETDWLGQVQSLARRSGCRWVVLPSSVDRYLPGAFEAVAALGRARSPSVVGQCRVLRDGQQFRLGPDPFRFDYFALLSGFNYIAPGAAFISVEHLVEAGGFDVRFSHALIYEFLLRTGAAHGVESCDVPLLETEADPFPGVPADIALLHASEAASACLAYNGFFLAPGAALGLVTTLAARVGPLKNDGFYDEVLVRVLASAGDTLRDRYHQYLALAEAAAPVVDEPEPEDATPAPEAPEPGGLSAFSEEAPHGVVLAPPGSLRSRIRAVTPKPLWDLLRRAKRAGKAFREPIY